ncbi:MAG: alpha/beta fold hydrolase [Bradymonadia bacterium]
MRKTPFYVSVLLALTGLMMSGCANMPKSYADKEPLPFSAYPYLGPGGEEWPHDYLLIPELNEGFGLPVNTTISYVELNPKGAETIVFVHGLGSYLKFWRYQLNHFANMGYRVIAIDMLGYGKSSKPAQFPYTMEAMAQVVRAVVQAKGVEKPILVGHSMGGQTSLSYAIQFPDELRALVLTAPAGFEKFSRREKAWFRSVLSVAFIKSQGEYNIWGSIARNNFYNWKSEYNWLIEERVRVVKTDDFNSYAYANVKSIHGLADNDFVRGSLDQVKVPTLIIHGDMDRLIPNPFMHGAPTREIMEYGHQGIKGSKLVTLEDCGHTLQMDCSARYNKEVRAFVKGLPAVQAASKQ